ncbi:excinuclease ABC subunit C [Rhodoligotrophos appendicifer]|uniref:excinuclease ABC subunit UvrC n=1 Tax=Rhodoligotrophos appendicifer TaxID=987056 RepID=UPI0011864BEE|nr:excinuclease ABC subunit UvrC [Rhodoligotrophos appendicifer]
MSQNLQSIDTDLEPTTVTIGIDVIRSVVRTAPARPGVYRMLDDKGTILYVGKARSLRGRLSSYTRLGGHTNRIATMISLTASMELIVTATEVEALLLEANLIKKLKPRYNVVLRDDKSFPYILIAQDHPTAQIAKHRGARNRKGSYFGPFASAGAVNRTINALEKAFLLRSCTDSVYENRTRPCLLYQIKRCSAPCTGYIGEEDYRHLVANAVDFLSGRSHSVKSDLAQNMEAASERLDFEQAARYRDRIAALSHVTAHQGINPQRVEEADVFGLFQEGGQTCIQVFFFRAGQNWGNRAYFPRADRSVEPGEVLESFIAQFYDDKPCPKLILISEAITLHELLETALATRAGHKVTISVPQRGEKRELITHAVNNAREALGRKLADTGSQNRLLEGVGRAFGLARNPRRIEIYDNSHIQGASPVGAMVVAGPEGFIKKEYRKFNIRDANAAGDDYAMMREVLTRRFSRLMKETAANAVEGPLDLDEAEDAEDEGVFEDIPAWPDLLLIDGGPGQLSAALGVLKDLGVNNVAVVGVAKGPERDAGREHFHMAGRSPFMLETRDPVLYYVQRLRDEAHRFAIGSHRARRKKTMGTNPLDDIPGIGPDRKRSLLRAFGSARAVARANVADLSAVAGVSGSLARTIYDYFHEGRS